MPRMSYRHGASHYVARFIESCHAARHRCGSIHSRHEAIAFHCFHHHALVTNISQGVTDTRRYYHTDRVRERGFRLSREDTVAFSCHCCHAIASAKWPIMRSEQQTEIQRAYYRRQRE